MLQGVRFISDTCYRVAGGDVGTADAIKKTLDAETKDVWSDLNPADSIRQIRPDQTSGRRLKSDLKKHI